MQLKIIKYQNSFYFVRKKLIIFPEHILNYIKYIFFLIYLMFQKIFDIDKNGVKIFQIFFVKLCFPIFIYFFFKNH